MGLAPSSASSATAEPRQLLCGLPQLPPCPQPAPPLCGLPLLPRCPQPPPTPPPPPPPPSVNPDSPVNPLQGKRVFMDCEASHQSSAAKYNPWYAVRRNPRYANDLRKIAQVPGTKWFSGIQELPTRPV